MSKLRQSLAISYSLLSNLKNQGAMLFETAINIFGWNIHLQRITNIDGWIIKGIAILSLEEAKDNSRAMVHCINVLRLSKRTFDRCS